RARHRLDRASRRRRDRGARQAQTALFARTRCPAAGRRALASSMIALVTRLFARSGPALSQARPSDARAMAALHGASFHRGWSDGEFGDLVLGRNRGAHRAAAGRNIVGFIVSRLAVDEAEILSIAVAPSRRGKGLARQLLDLNLRRLAGLGARTVFLEVEEG